MTDVCASPVLMIGLDAAEYTLVERWMDAGLLPNLAALRARGAQTRLQSTAHWLVGAPWPTFYMSSTAERFGMYHYLVWRPEFMAAARPAPDWMPLEPFWRQLPARGRRVIAIDVPLCYAPEDYGGIEVSGWATHELLQAPRSTPPGLLAQIRREFGVAPFDMESAHQLSAQECLAVRDQCVETALRVGALGCKLMREHPWDLSIVCLSSTHRGGHLLWDRSILKSGATESQRSAVDSALRDIYIACDTAIGRLIAQAGAGATTLVFSLHGMGVNNDRTSLLPEMLARVLEDRRGGDEPMHAMRLTDRLRRWLPDEWRARFKKHLPTALQDWLTLYWRSARTDWSRTEAFVAFCDLDGYIRINLRGRERDGIVAPEDFAALRERIAAGLRTFSDADTGAPLVSEIGYAEQLFADLPMRRHLPDMIVRWNSDAALSHRRVVSELYGAIDWPTPGRHPLGRSGNHHRQGFLLAAGPAIASGGLPDAAHILDLAPTVMDLLGLPQPAGWQGRSLLPR